jgi:hypothetical protein
LETLRADRDVDAVTPRLALPVGFREDLEPVCACRQPRRQQTHDLAISPRDRNELCYERAANAVEHNSTSGIPESVPGGGHAGTVEICIDVHDLRRLGEQR